MSEDSNWRQIGKRQREEEEDITARVAARKAAHEGLLKANRESFSEQVAQFLRAMQRAGNPGLRKNLVEQGVGEKILAPVASFSTGVDGIRELTWRQRLSIARVLRRWEAVSEQGWICNSQVSPRSSYRDPHKVHVCVFPDGRVGSPGSETLPIHGSHESTWLTVYSTIPDDFFEGNQFPAAVGDALVSVLRNNGVDF